jgi:hypothetical protein
VLERARLWYGFFDDYVTLLNQKPPVGTVLTPDEQQRLFEMAQNRSSWPYVYVATMPSFYCDCEPAKSKPLYRWAGRRSGQSAAARQAIEDAGRLASANAERNLPVRRSLPSRSGGRPSLRRTGPLRVSVARAGQAPRSGKGDDLLAHRVAQYQKAQDWRTSAFTMAATPRSRRSRKRAFRIG